MKRMLWIIALVIIGTGSHAQAPRSLFEEGNQLYRAEQYNEALETYREIIDEGYESAALYFNIGNAYYKTNQVARAILYYERAARLSPRDNEIQQNLNIARQSTIDKFEEMPRPIAQAVYLAVLQALSPGGWAVAALAGFGILVLGTFLYLFTAYRRYGFSLGAAGLIIGGICLALAFSHRQYIEENRGAIVMRTSSYVKSGPGERAEDVFILHEGAKVKVTEEYENWRKIRLPDGKVGWIQAEDVKLI